MQRLKGGMRLTRDQILSSIAKGIGDGAWVLAALAWHGKPVAKEKLRDITNAYYRRAKPDEAEMPIRSRHLLDEMAARLEGAALVTVFPKGKAKMYMVSELGNELIQHMRKGG
jgi:hypothetical protein